MVETWLDLLADFAEVKGQRKVLSGSLILSSYSASLGTHYVSAQMLHIKDMSCICSLCADT